MARSNAKGATFFSEGTQNQQILANFLGNWKNVYNERSKK